MSKKLKNKGFTLVEALVAIAILIVSIVGPMTIASKGLTASVFAKDQITAFYLAQEAVEFIRYERDNFIIKGTGQWLSGNLGICRDDGDGDACIVDVSNPQLNLRIQPCPGGQGTCPVLKYNADTNFYNYTKGADSKFTREIILTEIRNNREEQITVTVSWSTGFLNRTFTVKENIFNLF